MCLISTANWENWNSIYFYELHQIILHLNSIPELNIFPSHSSAMLLNLWNWKISGESSLRQFGQEFFWFSNISVVFRCSSFRWFAGMSSYATDLSVLFLKWRFLQKEYFGSFSRIVSISIYDGFTQQKHVVCLLYLCLK